MHHASILAGSDFQRLPGPASSFEDFWREEIPSSHEAIVYLLDPDLQIQDRIRSLLSPARLEVRPYQSLKHLLAVPQADLAGCVVADARLLLNGHVAEPRPLADLGLNLPVIVTAPEPDVALAVHAMKAGAADFLAKPFHDQDILTAIRAAIEADRRRRVADSERRSIVRLYGTLTGRERQVVDLVTAGKMNKQIAWELGVSEITVKVHRGSAMRKMRARSLPDLIRMMESISPDDLSEVGSGVAGSR